MSSIGIGSDKGSASSVTGLERMLVLRSACSDNRGGLDAVARHRVGEELLGEVCVLAPGNQAAHHPSGLRWPGSRGGRSTSTAGGQEAVVVELRRMLLLPLDDLLLVTPEFINAAVSHLGLDRCMRRHGVSQLRALQVLPEGEQPRAKTFKDCEPGFIHVDIKYLPQMFDEGQRRYLFVAINRATRWVFVHIYADQSEVSSCDFLSRLYQAAPMKISKILTDNGSQLTDRFTGKTKQPSGKHAFDKRCAGLEIEHRLAPPRHPQTNVGWSSDSTLSIADVIRQTRFKSRAEHQATLTR